MEPARRAGLEVEDGLVEVLLRDLAPKTPGAPGTQDAHEPGALPLLSHALLSTWELSSTSTIAVADYRASGGIFDAISRTAESVFGDLSGDQQEMARRLFLRLAIASDWAGHEDNRNSLSPLASEFVAAAVSEEKARERAERNRTRRLQRLVGALAVLVVAVFGLAGYSYQQRMTAASARNDADSREVAVEAGQVRGQNTPLAAADGDGTVSMWSLPSPVLMAGSPVNSVAFSPAGNLLAVGS